MAETLESSPRGCGEAESVSCDMCGPFTPEQAAALVLDTWKPTPTGRLCDRCRPVVALMAQDLARAIDERAAEYAYHMTA